MKVRILIGLALSILLINACKKDEEPPKVIYSNDSKTANTPAKVDTVSVQVADLPIVIPGTGFLIYPIGKLSLRSDYKSSNAYSGEISSNVPSTISNFRDFEITGNLSNLKFQKIGQDSIYALSEKPVYIQTATFLNEIAEKTKNRYFIYTLEDDDTNRDGMLNEKDIKTLYISDGDGKNFTKLTADFQELIDWKVIAETSSIYFRTVEDSNKNGKFDISDKIHYNVLKLPGSASDVKTYQVL